MWGNFFFFGGGGGGGRGAGMELLGHVSYVRIKCGVAALCQCLYFVLNCKLSLFNISHSISILPV